MHTLGHPRTYTLQQWFGSNKTFWKKKQRKALCPLSSQPHTRVSPHHKQTPVRAQRMVTFRLSTGGSRLGVRFRHLIQVKKNYPSYIPRRHVVSPFSKAESVSTASISDRTKRPTASKTASTLQRTPHSNQAKSVALFNTASLPDYTPNYDPARNKYRTPNNSCPRV